MNGRSITGLLIGRGEKKSNFAGVLGTNSLKNRPISREISGQTSPKAISRKQPILWLFSRQISPEIDRFLH